MMQHPVEPYKGLSHLSPLYEEAKIVISQPLPMSDPEERRDLVERFVLRFRNFFVREDPEESEEDTEREKGVVL